ncbi:hypothetical protein PLEOSDRAFT_161249 [Pleurotus ostreatus PC15]|uniref:Uncharacterized protein n=1 Tax=Pleurotus ostreatus (strain PC15) TaxID=1137138 RepID=A0A067NCM8_PLEO1|nr:hypothetical protein PLEOSDRAFT_161249 [Pleurotus ostreatus PC15]
MTFLRSVFTPKKGTDSALPPNWPSPLHNKCSAPGCTFPNPPQVAKGVYDCQGVPGGFYCDGTYRVSSAKADSAERYFKEEFRIESTNKRRQRLMEKRRYEEEHYKQAHYYPVRRQRVASEAAAQLPVPAEHRKKNPLSPTSLRHRVASEPTAEANASLHRRIAQRRNPAQECAIPGVREYYQHNIPVKVTQQARQPHQHDKVKSTSDIVYHHSHQHQHQSASSRAPARDLGELPPSAPRNVRSQHNIYANYTNYPAQQRQ